MPHTFTIDPSKINQLTYKLLRRVAIMYLIAIAIVYLPTLNNNHDPLSATITSLIFIIGVMTFVTFRIVSRYKKTMTQLEIIFSEKGVEYKAPMAPYKFIGWNDAGYTVKENGIIKIFSKSEPAINKWWMGKGTIVIPVEITNREQLLNELYTYIST